MSSDGGRFVWYELLTTNMPAAKAFYGNVFGWEAQDASTPSFAYSLFVAGESPACGLMELPMEARKMGATPRWIGYVAVTDVDTCVARLTSLGGTLYVPPTDSNIGRIAVVADAQRADFALVEGFKLRPSKAGDEGCVGWHELTAADGQSAFAFYSELFGWQKEAEPAGATDSYQLVSCGGRMIGGIFTKLRRANYPPFWQYYFNVADIGVTAKRVKAAGGRIVQGALDMPDGTSIIRCVDPHGAIFALQGARSAQDADDVSASEFGWAAEWGGFSSRGRLVAKPKPPEEPRVTSEAESRPKSPAKSRPGVPAKPKR